MRLRLELLSGTLFASGFGLAHHLDADVEHDLRTGLPVVRGRTLKGLLTEACAEVLAGLGQTGRADRFVLAALEAFGVPGSSEAQRGRLRVGPARLPQAFRAHVEGKTKTNTQDARPEITTEQVLGSLTAVRRRTAIDEATGTASNRSLRAQRMLREGLVLDAALDADDLGPDARFLVALAAAAVQHAGTGRARGAGSVRLTVYDGDVDLTREAIEALRQAGADRLPEVPAAFAPAPAPSPGAKQGGGTTLRLRFRLDQPLLVRGGKGDPNTGVGLPCIPGSSLRGAAIGRYLASRPRGVDLAADPEARRLFFDGEAVRFLAAYPVEHGVRTLPTPASWFADKQDKTRGADHAAGRLDFGLGEWRRLKKPFVQIGDARRVAEPTRVVNVHIQRARGYASQNEADRTVYRYDALAEGQTFEALVRCADAAACAAVAAWFPVGARFSFGTAGTAGYGGATVVTATAEPPAPEAVRCGTAPDGRAVVVFTAPVALRDPETGLFTTDPDVLGHALGGTVEEVWGETERPSGFNRTWGLPLPQHPTWKAGTTVKLSGVDRAKLADLAASGVGERRAEGFGQFVVDAFSDHPTWTFEPNEPEEQDGPDVPDAEDAAVWPLGYVDELLERLSAQVGEDVQKDELASEAARLADAARLASDEAQRLTRTQLEAVQRLLETPDKAKAVAAVQAHFEKMPNDARRKWRSVRLESGQRLDEWIAERLGSAPDSPNGKDADDDATRGWLHVATLVRTVLRLLAKRQAL